MVCLENLARTFNLGDEMTPEKKQKIESMCYREVSALKRELEKSPEPFKDADYFNKVLKSKEWKVNQGGHMKKQTNFECEHFWDRHDY